MENHDFLCFETTGINLRFIRYYRFDPDSGMYRFTFGHESYLDLKPADAAIVIAALGATATADALEATSLEGSQ